MCCCFFMKNTVVQHLSVIYHLFSLILFSPLQPITSTTSTISTTTGEDDVGLDCNIETQLFIIVIVFMKNTVIQHLILI